MMNTIKIFVKDLKGNEHCLETSTEQSLMNLIVNSGIQMAASCGGGCSCATCHVHVDPEWFDRVGEGSEDEQDMLDWAFDLRPNSRLSCQIWLNETHDGLRVAIKP